MGKITPGGLEARTVYLWPSQWSKLEEWDRNPGQHPAVDEARQRGDLRDNSASAVLRHLVDWDAVGVVRERNHWQRQAQELEQRRGEMITVAGTVLMQMMEALLELDPEAAQSAVQQLSQRVKAEQVQLAPFWRS